MSVSRRRSVEPHFGQAAPGGVNSVTGVEYQTPAPAFSTASATFPIIPASTTAPSQALQSAIGIGTPQVRWRLMHQSGRVSSMPRIRALPHCGTHCTWWSI